MSPVDRDESQPSESEYVQKTMAYFKGEILRLRRFAKIKRNRERRDRKPKPPTPGFAVDLSNWPNLHPADLLGNPEYVRARIADYEAEIERLKVEGDAFIPKGVFIWQPK